jgi:hypothetical protein
MMRHSLAIGAALALASAAHASKAETWVPVGLDRGRQVAVNVDSVPANKTAPFTAPLASFPQGWSANSHRYTVAVAEFDCSARTRVLKFVSQFSSRRDPVTRPVNQRPLGDADPAVAAQLAVVCGDPSAVGRGRQFNHLGEFGDYLRH